MKNTNKPNQNSEIEQEDVSLEKLLTWSLDELIGALTNPKYGKIHFKIVIVLFILEKALNKLQKETLEYNKLEDTEKDLIKTKYPCEHDEITKQIEEEVKQLEKSKISISAKIKTSNKDGMDFN